ncbi:GDSL esterase/lipase [Zea mays]|uniref:GDSL esterase/lipase n=1 Tax=Zea mays TaxID=4577 RepID=A0A3L6F9L5_MAIZE|nr:GDSL esterase/lipase [Zea mays]
MAAAAVHGRRRRLLLLLAALLHLLLVVPPPVQAARVTALIVFGDSTVDAGNNNVIPTVARSNFPPYGRNFPPEGRASGRFSDGRLATDFYSEALGLGRAFVPAYLDPHYGIRDFAIGVCFASAGSGLDVATSRVLRVIPLWKQLDMFREYMSRLDDHLGATEAHAVVAGAVYAVSIGTNDFIENYFALTTTRFLEFTPGEYTDYLVGLARGFLAELYSLGARKIGFTGLAPMGCLPLERARALGRCAEEYNAAARAFNAALVGMVRELGEQLPGSDIRVAEVYDFFEDMVRDPGRHGFARADVGCCGTGTYEMGYACGAWAAAPAGTCPDADRYVFWDAVHPTERASRLVADHLMNTTFGRFA